MFSPSFHHFSLIFTDINISIEIFIFWTVDISSKSDILVLTSRALSLFLEIRDGKYWQVHAGWESQKSGRYYALHKFMPSSSVLRNQILVISVHVCLFSPKFLSIRGLNTQWISYAMGIFAYP